MSTPPPTTYAELADLLRSLPLLVREKRRRQGLSLRAAADQSGVDFSTMRRYEAGENIMLAAAIDLLVWVGQP